ncbi:MAG: helix-turn-helix transcriptional regulator [Lachnospiraceae bacterium]|nr:helix-turn-helix transcriptional regulator [Lachnospiraceae bacterium]MBD5454976.1 helix-turn-helix transcriptional regulator [Lachnospiraceae bacterium]
MLDKRVGERIRFLRESNDYTRDDLASRANISTKFLYEIEMGKKGCSAEVLLELSKELSVSCDYLLTGKKNGSGNTEKAAIILESIDPWQMGRVENILRLIQEISRGV